MNEIKLLDLNTDWQQVRPKLETIHNTLMFSGYQSFLINELCVIPVSDNTKLKYSLIKNTVYLDTNGKSVTDLGCSNMFFGHLARSYGALDVTGVELDQDYLIINKKIIETLDLKNINCLESNAVDYTKTADTVFAFAIIHWIYSCSGFLGSLEKVIQHLKEITGHCLYIEWIDPSDDCIEHFRHLSYNNDLISNDYNKESFLKYLHGTFSNVSFLGFSKNTREVYRCTV